jgi:hypothetical protein
MVYFAYRSIEALAGTETTSNIVLKLVTELKADKYIAYIFGFAGVGYGVGERVLRRKTVKRLHPRIKDLELKLDAHRSTSRLSPTGDTRPEDEI